MQCEKPELVDTNLMKWVIPEFFLHTRVHLRALHVCLAGAGRVALSTVQEVLPQHIFSFWLWPCTLRVLSGAWAPRTAASTWFRCILQPKHPLELMPLFYSTAFPGRDVIKFRLVNLCLSGFLGSVIFAIRKICMLIASVSKRLHTLGYRTKKQQSMAPAF